MANINFEFKECQSCKAKSGTPILCISCLHNQYVINKLTDVLKDVQKLAKEVT